MTQMSLFAKQKQRHRHTKQTYGTKEGRGRDELGVVIYMHYYKNQIDNEDLLYSTGNSTQCYLVT